MSKYIKLTLFLGEREADRWEASFEDVEDILGFALPQSARQYPAWWANQGRAQSAAWQSVGWISAAVDVDRERVTFIRAAEEAHGHADEPKVLTIAEAKAALAAQFGVPLEAIEITIRG